MKTLTKTIQVPIQTLELTPEEAKALHLLIGKLSHNKFNELGITNEDDMRILDSIFNNIHDWLRK